MRARTPDYPPAPPAPRRRTFGSVTFDDPYAFLEEDDERVLGWQAAQDAFAAAWLANLPAYGAMAARVARLDADREVHAPRFAGGRWFRQVLRAGEDGPAIEVAAEPGGPGRRVVDLNGTADPEPRQLSWYSPSPDGRLLAYSSSTGVVETFRVLEVDGGAVLVDGLPQARATSPAWLPDGRGFYYRAQDPAGHGRSAIYLHVFGEAPPTRPEPLDLGPQIAWPQLAGDGRSVFVVADHLEPRPLYVREFGPAGAWRPFLRDVRGMFRGVVVGDRFVAITNDGAPRGRLVSIPLASPCDRAGWRELVPPSSNVLASVAAAGGRIVLVELVETYARMRVLRPDGSPDGPDGGAVALPGRGVVSTDSSVTLAISFLECVHPGAGDEVVFVHASPVEAPSVWRADLARRTCTPVTEPAARLDARVLDLAAVSRDGTRVPCQVVLRRDVEGPAPALVFAYGGFNVALVPGWLPVLAAWVDAGGVLALAHPRGGGELGPDWWHAGRLDNKPRAFEDLYAVAEHLCARGLTAPDRLGVYGISSGGTLAAVAAVSRPDLFRAAVPQVALTDAFGLVRDPISLMIAAAEDGDPRDPRASARLHAWSPYHNVKDGAAYPAVLLDCGAGDPRCPAWHGRKLAARLQRASSSGRPVLLRVRRNVGHRAVGEAARRRQQAELLAFLAAELGLPA